MDSVQFIMDLLVPTLLPKATNIFKNIRFIICIWNFAFRYWFIKGSLGFLVYDSVTRNTCYDLEPNRKQYLYLYRLISGEQTIYLILMDFYSSNSSIAIRQDIMNPNK